MTTIAKRLTAKATLALALGTGFCLYASSASADTFYLQAGSGHPHLTAGTATWANEWNSSGWLILDGRSIQLPTNGGSSAAWDTPIPINLTNANWSAVAFGSGATNRICTFNSSGAFSSCGATAPTSTAFVPTDGTAYSQTFFTCSTEFCTVTLFHIKAFH